MNYALHSFLVQSLLIDAGQVQLVVDNATIAANKKTILCDALTTLQNAKISKDSAPLSPVRTSSIKEITSKSRHLSNTTRLSNRTKNRSIEYPAHSRDKIQPQSPTYNCLHTRTPSSLPSNENQHSSATRSPCRWENCAKSTVKTISPAPRRPQRSVSIYNTKTSICPQDSTQVIRQPERQPSILLAEAITVLPFPNDKTKSDSSFNTTSPNRVSDFGRGRRSSEESLSILDASSDALTIFED